MHIDLYQLRPLAQGLLDGSLVLHEKYAPLLSLDLSQRVLQHKSVSALSVELDHKAARVFHQSYLESPSFQELLDQVPLARGSEDKAVAIFIVVISQFLENAFIFKKMLEYPVAPCFDDGDAFRGAGGQVIFWHGTILSDQTYYHDNPI